MGFAPVPSLLFLFLLVALPAIAVVGTIVIVLMCGHSRWINGTGWWPFKSKRIVYFVVLPVVLLDAGVSLGAWKSHELSVELEHQRVRREARRDFVLEQEFQYGELLISAGTRIKKFEVLIASLDAIAELGKEAPDGPKANFWPSQWRFAGCSDGYPILESKR